MQILTIATPEALRADANQFARCLGLGPDDELTFGLALWVDANNNRYCVASGLVSDDFAQRAQAVLTEPTWGCDLEAAQRAQTLLVQDTTATTDHISYVLGLEPNIALVNMGLTPGDSNE